LTKGERIIAFLQKSGGELKRTDGFSIWQVNWLTTLGEAHDVSGEDLLETDLASGLNSNDPALHFEALHWLQGFRQLTPEITLRLRNILDSRSTRLDERLTALATLLRDPKPEYVEMAAKMAQTQAQVIPLYTNAARQVGSALQWVKSPEALPSLVAIFESKVAGWHAPAMYAIRVMQDPKTVPLLIKALDDPDPEAAYHALFALTQITHKGGDFGPGIGEFEHDPGKYVQFWKHWWETEGEAEYGRGFQNPKP
jgi:HEAT repeat protein